MPRKIAVKKVKMKRLQEGHQQLEKTQSDNAQNAYRGHAPEKQRPLMPDHDNEHQDGREHHVSGVHMAKRTYCQHESLDEIHHDFQARE